MERIKLFFIGLIFISIYSNAQSFEMKISLRDTCIKSDIKIIPIAVSFQNLTQKDYWIDLKAINLSIYKADTKIEPNQTPIIDFFTPEGITVPGLIFIKKLSKVNITNHTSIFSNYFFEEGIEYRLIAEYKNPKKKLFKKIYDQKIDSECLSFSVCKL